MHRTELTELIRNGESSGVEFKRDDEEARLYMQSGRLPYDRKPVPGATLDELDRRRLGNYFRDFRAQDCHAGAVRECYGDFRALAQAVAERSGIALP